MVGAGIISIPAFKVVRILEGQEQARTEYYLSIRVEDVAVDDIRAHLERVEAAHRWPTNWMEPEIRHALAQFPGGKLFFFNTSEEQWRRLGGEAGYAIILDGRIVWKRRLAIS